jgi:hypothetical protein
MFLSVGGGRSCIFNFGTSLGVRRQYFLTLWWTLPNLQLCRLLGGPPSLFLSVGGGCSRIFSSGTSQGAAT